MPSRVSYKIALIRISFIFLISKAFDETTTKLNSVKWNKYVADKLKHTVFSLLSFLNNLKTIFLHVKKAMLKESYFKVMAMSF